MINSLTAHAFGALALNGVALGGVALAGAIGGEKLVAARQRWIVGAVVVAIAGYLVFWAGFWRPPVGRACAWSVLALALATIVWRRRTAKELLCAAAPVAIGTTLFVFAATALMLLYPRETMSDTAALRFLAWMPGDNSIPRVFAEIIDSGNPTRVLGGDWLTSDRPPLQTGVALLAWPLLSALGIDLDTACATAGIWFQALWFPAMWLLLRTLGLTARAALGVTAALSGTGFLLFNSVYVWPKLGGAAFVVAAFVLWFAPRREERETDPRSRLMLGAACAACGWLAHGGVMFSLLALAPLAMFDVIRAKTWRDWAWAAGVFVLLAAPWLLYQRYYSPPGNRLVKWHIAGVIPPDTRTVAQALNDRYREIGWRGAWDARVQNFHMLFAGGWRETFDPRADAASRRTNDAFFPLRTAAGWTLGLAALPWLLLARRRLLREHLREHLLCAGWLIGGVAAWLALMFFPQQVFTHQGTLVTQLLLLALLATWAWMAGRIFFALVVAVQWIGFLATWIGPSTAPPVALDRLAAVVAVACGTALLALAGWMLVGKEKSPDA